MTTAYINEHTTATFPEPQSARQLRLFRLEDPLTVRFGNDFFRSRKRGESIETAFVRPFTQEEGWKPATPLQESLLRFFDALDRYAKALDAAAPPAKSPFSATKNPTPKPSGNSLRTTKNPPSRWGAKPLSNQLF